jgi:putative protein-disulfide isomerase
LDDGSAVAEFERDLVRSRELGGRGFPTLILDGADGRLVLHGWLAAARLEHAFLAVSATAPRPPVRDMHAAGELLGTGTGPEYAAILGPPLAAAESVLGAEGLPRRPIGRGAVWTPTGS